jgi:hypothetical protein
MHQFPVSDDTRREEGKAFLRGTPAAARGEAGKSGYCGFVPGGRHGGLRGRFAIRRPLASQVDRSHGGDLHQFGLICACFRTGSLTWRPPRLLTPTLLSLRAQAPLVQRVAPVVSRNVACIGVDLAEALTPLR